ncbi:MAG TPA: hypothetical protein VFX49_12695, partial [Chloroflexota bacterium]|nr:hypothetical protein [Chloroflexota bacterium]
VVWRKSDIDLLVIGRDEHASRLVSSVALVEDGVDIHASVYPRSKFKQAIERTAHGAFMHSAFALSTLLFTTDDTIRAYYDDLERIGTHDRQMRIMAAGSSVIYFLAKSEKWLVTRGDVSYSFLWIMYMLQYLATVEVLLHNQLTTREVVPQALALSPELFGPLYRDLIHQPKDAATIRTALATVHRYLEDRLDTLFGPILEYLRSEGGARSISELDTHFAKQAQDWPLSIACEWLADKGVIHKVSSPIRLHPKSQVALDEAAYYYDGVAAPHGGHGGDGWVRRGRATGDEHREESR